MAQHHKITGFKAYHEVTWRGSADPAATPANDVQPHQLWMDETGGTAFEAGAILKERNAGNTAWATRMDLATALAATLATAAAAATTYTDAKVAGLSWKQEVRAATVAAGTLASSFENGDTIDGVVLATGNRILIKNQAAPAENGIYIVNASGAPTRSTDADAAIELVNATCYVSEGTVNADTQWTCSTNAPITVGATGLTFVQLATGGVTTFNGRTGVVVPASGDYAVADVTGAAPLASPTFTGVVTVPTPTNPTDAVTKAYADALAQGLSFKPAAVVATAAALPANTYANGSSGVGATLTATATGTLTVDGHVVALNEYVLVKDEATGSHNGLYKCTTAGAGGVAYILTRAIEMDATGEFVSSFIFVQQGTANSGTAWVCSNTTAPTVGTTAITFTQFSAPGVATYSDHIDRSLYSGSFASDSDDFDGGSLGAAWADLNPAAGLVKTVANGRLVLKRLSSDTAFDGPRGVVRATPAGNWKFQTRVACWSGGISNYHHAGIWARRAGGTPPNASNVSTDKCAGVGIGGASGTGPYGIGGINCATGSGGSGASGSFLAPKGFASTCIIQMEYDGTNINWYVGDGSNFTLYKSVNAAAQIGGAPDSLILATYMWFDTNEQLGVFDYCWRVA